MPRFGTPAGNGLVQPRALPVPTPKLDRLSYAVKSSTELSPSDMTAPSCWPVAFPVQPVCERFCTSYVNPRLKCFAWFGLARAGPTVCGQSAGMPGPDWSNQQITRTGQLAGARSGLRRFRRSRNTWNRRDRFEALCKHQLLDAFCDHFVEPLSQGQLTFQVRDGCCFPDGDQWIELAKLLASLIFFRL